jgi:hypothetical protein
VRSTGITANNVHTLMTFGKHRFDFEWKKTSARRKYWRLKVKDPAAANDGKPAKRKRKKKPAAPETQDVKQIRSKWGPKDVVFEEVEGGDTKRVK